MCCECSLDSDSGCGWDVSAIPHPATAATEHLWRKPWLAVLGISADMTATRLLCRLPSRGFDSDCAWARVQVSRIAPPPGDVNMNMDNFGRLHLWAWTEYSRVVYIDADCIVMRDISGLFQLPAGINAAVGAPRRRALNPKP